MGMASPFLMTWTPQNGYLELRKIYSTQRHDIQCNNFLDTTTILCSVHKH